MSKTCPAKHTDLRGHTSERLAAVAHEINARPRKTLGSATPADPIATAQ